MANAAASALSRKSETWVHPTRTGVPQLERKELPTSWKSPTAYHQDSCPMLDSKYWGHSSMARCTSGDTDGCKGHTRIVGAGVVCAKASGKYCRKDGSNEAPRKVPRSRIFGRTSTQLNQPHPEPGCAAEDQLIGIV